MRNILKFFFRKLSLFVLFNLNKLDNFISEVLKMCNLIYVQTSKENKKTIKLCANDKTINCAARCLPLFENDISEIL